MPTADIFFQSFLPQPPPESGSSPPSDPPPAPPPLNLPPSRARRQLAARLARKAEAENISSKEGVDDITSDDMFRDVDDHEFSLNDGNGSWAHDDISEEKLEKETGLDASPEPSTHETPPKDEERKRLGGRHLDLDDFANSPAADADDTASTDSGEDVEMRVALG